MKYAININGQFSQQTYSDLQIKQNISLEGRQDRIGRSAQQPFVSCNVNFVTGGFVGRSHANTPSLDFTNRNWIDWPGLLSFPIACNCAKRVLQGEVTCTQPAHEIFFGVLPVVQAAPVRVANGELFSPDTLQQWVRRDIPGQAFRTD